MFNRGLAAVEEGSLHREVVPKGALISLQNRRKAIEASLMFAEPSTVVKLLTTLNRMAVRVLDDEREVEAFVRQEVEDLSDISAWALDQAVVAYRRGDVGDGKWRPTAGQIRQEARRREQPVRAELYQLQRLLDHRDLEKPKPEPLSPERREELIRLLRETAASFGESPKRNLEAMS